MQKELNDKLKDKSISLEKFGLNDLAWKKEDAKSLLQSIRDDKIGVLGGEVFKMSSNQLIPLYDNWACEPQNSETDDEFYIRSKSESLKYIKNYPCDGMNDILFSITFTEKIDPR